MTTKKLNLTQQIEASLSYVFYMFNNKSGWMEWFAAKAYGYAKKKSIMRVYFEPEGDYLFLFTAEEPEQRMAFDLTDLETKEVSQVEVSFEEDNGVVTVTLEHSGVPAEKEEYYRQMWHKSLENLKSMTETGKDLRMWGRPFLGVTVEAWLSPELAEEKGLPVDHGMLLSSVIPGRGAEEAGLAKDDIIVSMAGQDLKNYHLFLDLLRSLKAGNVVKVGFYRNGELHEIELELSAYPVSDPPATAHDYADKVKQFHRGMMEKLTGMVEEYNEAQLDFRPGPGEWSAKETLAHLISTEMDTQVWASTLVAGCEEFICSSSHAIRIKSLLTIYPTGDELLEQLTQRQQETAALLAELPAEFVNRKGSFARMATHLNLELSKHYKEHVSQIKESLAKAENVRVN